MRAVAAISGHCRPLIIEHTRSGLAGVHHRLDGQHHAIAQPRSVAASSKVRNLRLFVQLGSNAVSHKLTHYAETIGLNKFLHRCADIADGIPNSGCLNAAIERLLRNFEQLAQLRSEQSIDRNGHRRVTVIAIEDNAAIDGNNVSGLQRPLFRRNSVYDLFVDRSTKHARVIVITLESRLCAQFFDLALGCVLQIHRSRARLYQRAHFIEHFPDNAATAPHLVNFRCRFTNNRHAQPPSAASARWFSINRTICRVTSSTGRSPLTETRRPLHS